jgi:multidrug resistance efflux pump
MSTGSFPDAHFTGAQKPLHASVTPSSRPSVSEDREVDRELVRETRDQIRALVDEITVLSRSDCSPGEFYQGFLTRSVAALACSGGAIWSKPPGSPSLKLEYQIHPGQTSLPRDVAEQKAHGLLLEKIAAAGNPELVLPRSGQAGVEGNPTDYLLVIAPLKIEKDVVGLVEIFQRAGGGPSTQRGYLRFLVQMAALASDFLRNHRLRLYEAQQSQWNRMQSFVRAVHRGLNIRQTVYAIANEGRAVLDAERVSVAIRQGGRLEVRAVSGLDSVERRAEQVKLLARLATAVARAGQPLWYTGDDSGLPPQIEELLHEYLDASHARMVVVQPLHGNVPVDGDENPGGPLDEDQGPATGALIIEQFSDERPAAGLAGRLQVVTDHCNDALANSLAHSNMFLAPLWTWLGQTMPVVLARRLPRIALAGCAIMLAILSLFIVPWPFSLAANGRLIPEKRVEVFAAIDGVLQELRVPEDPEAVVSAGDILAIMNNNQLLVEIRNLQGQLDQAEEKVRKLQRAMVRQSELNAVERGIIDGDFAEAQELKESLSRQLQLKRDELDLLTIRAPETGRVVNWQLRQNLLRRPVQRGQNLMTIVAPDTPWQIELELPEKRVAHLMGALAHSGEPLPVSFVLASHPGKEFEGTLIQVDNKLDVRGDEGNSVLLRVQFDSVQLPAELLRSGTRVMAKVQAGNRSLGYVWFHEFIESVQTALIRWF